MNPILLTLALLASLPAAFAANLGFANMENGDRIEVTEHSTGCFHNLTSYYEVLKSEGIYKFREYGIEWSKDKPPKVVEKKLLGEMELTEDDIKGLDLLLKFYRGEKEAFSTTQNSLTLEYFEGKKRVKLEKLEDRSGGYEVEKIKGIVLLGELSSRLKMFGAPDGPAPKPKP